jgi:hypothetical protein
MVFIFILTIIMATSILSSFQYRIAISYKYPLDEILEGFRISEDNIGMMIIINP